MEDRYFVFIHLVRENEQDHRENIQYTINRDNDKIAQLPI